MPAGEPAGDGGLCRVLAALAFAARAHANQRRKGAAQEPYVNHLIEVAELVAQATGGQEPELVIAALLHDVIEDTPLAREDIEAQFGARVAEIVAENSDDMSLPKDERRKARIAKQSCKSAEARVVKTADAISNLRAMAQSPPAGWVQARKLGYLEGCRALIDAGRGANGTLESLFDATVAEVDAALRNSGDVSASEADGIEARLSADVGQPVHLVYLANTEGKHLGEADTNLFCDLIAERFPSATVQKADAVYEGRRRPILLCRIRTDSTSAVVAFAQALCVAFNQRFVGIEVDGRYIRVYADDTA